MVRKIVQFSATLVLFLFSVGWSQDIKITARVDRNPVGLDEQFTYEVEVSGPVQNLPDIELPDFSKFAVIGGPSVSSSFQIINFKMSASKIYTLVLMPREAGTFRIGAAVAQYKGKTYRSNEIELTVVKQGRSGSASRQRPPASTKDKPPADVDLSQTVFLQVIPSKRTAYVNEEVTLRYKIYFRTRITNNQIVKMPEAVGCWVEEYPVPRRPRIYTETIKGVQYNVAEIRKVAIFPNRSGKITVTPLELLVETVVRRQRSRDPFDMFDDFFGDPFGQVVQKKLSSGTVTLNVLPLPEEGKPADFSGLVGDFRIHSSIDKRSCQTNEALSYKVKISGRGLLKFLNELPVQFSPDFEVYEPKINQTQNKSGGRITSNKEFEYVIIPRVPGDKEIKSFRLSYFNPADKQYHYLTVPAYHIQVSKGKELALGMGNGTGLSKEEIQLLGKDIRFIKEDVPDFLPVGYAPYRSWWFVLGLVMPLVVLGGAWGYRSHLEKMSTNVQYARSRKARKLAQQRLKEAKSFWKQGRAGEFYGAVSRGLIGYVADKTNQPAAGLLREDVKKILESRGVNGELQQEFLKCLDEADFRRFAPGDVSDEEMKNFYQRAENILVKLEKYF